MSGYKKQTANISNASASSAYAARTDSFYQGHSFDDTFCPRPTSQWSVAHVENIDPQIHINGTSRGVVKGYGEKVTSIFSSKWEDLIATMQKNHWPKQVVSSLNWTFEDVSSLQTLKYEPKSAFTSEWSWSKILDLAALDPTNQSDWIDICAHVTKVSQAADAADENQSSRNRVFTTFLYILVDTLRINFASSLDRYDRNYIYHLRSARKFNEAFIYAIQSVAGKFDVSPISTSV
jgi:hypothetical protein